MVDDAVAEIIERHLRELVDPGEIGSALAAPVVKGEDVEGGFRLEGMVEKPLKFKYWELMQQFSRVEMTSTLTCAGNRRHGVGRRRGRSVGRGHGVVRNSDREFLGRQVN